MELISSADWIGSERNKLRRKTTRKLVKAHMYVVTRYVPFCPSPDVVL
jgi:hypothetical protein